MSEPSTSGSARTGREAIVRALRTHLLPLLDGDLDAVATRTGVGRDTLRKYRTFLRTRRARRPLLPAADTLVAILTAYEWPLDRFLDPACTDPTVPLAALPTSQTAPSVVAAHAAAVLRQAGVPVNDPDACALVERPAVLLRVLEQAVVDAYAVTRAERVRRREADLEARCTAAAEHLIRDDVLWRATEGTPALTRAVAVHASRLRRALSVREHDSATGELMAGHLVVAATDPWELARDLLPSFERLLGGDDALATFVTVEFEVTAAEVGSAHAFLRPRMDRNDSRRRWHPDHLVAAFERLLHGRGYPPGLVRPLADLVRASQDGDRGAFDTPQALNALFADFCKAVGVVWDGELRHFAPASAGRGHCDAQLMPAWDDTRLIVTSWPPPTATPPEAPEATEPVREPPQHA